MDKVIEYQFWYGGMNDLKRGRFDNLTRVSSQDGLSKLVSQKKSEIIIPEFVGVYQETTLKPDSAKERQYLQVAELLRKSKENLIDNTIATFLQETGEEDSCHPKLIHIGYTPVIENPSLVREFFGAGMKRIGISPYQNLPDFAAKDTFTIEQYMQRVNEALLQGDREEVKSLAKEACAFLEQQRKSFGLIRVEYVFMNGMWQMANPLPQERKIITDVQGINPLVDLSHQVLNAISEREK